MKAISLWQPYATLVALGVKPLETRHWPTNYRGPLAIQATKGFPPECRDLCDTELFRSALMPVPGFAEEGWRALPTGAVVATCQLADCIPSRLIMPRHDWPGGDPYWHPTYRLLMISEQMNDFGDFSAGRFAWLLKEIEALAEPIPAKGAQGLWEWRDGWKRGRP